MEPEFERGNTPPKTRPPQQRRIVNYGPIALRRRVEVPPQQLDLTPGELRADQGPRLPITVTAVALLNPELSLSSDNKIVRRTRKTR